MKSELTDILTTVLDYIRYATSRFQAAGLSFGHGTATALDEAAALVLHATHSPHDLPTGFFAATLLPDEREAVVRLIERRFSPWLGERPVADILDLCTGSGCIAMASAYAFPEAMVDAVDISTDALAVAAINLARHDLGDSVHLIRSDLYTGLPSGKRYDLIVSNPPYVNVAEWENLPGEYHAEPRLGLEAGADGLDCVRRILMDAAERLKPDGILVVEVGSSAEALEAAYPEIPFLWLEFVRGGDGVFLLTAGQVEQYLTE